MPTRLLPDGGHDLPDKLKQGYLFELALRDSDPFRSGIVLFDDVTYNHEPAPTLAGTTLSGAAFDVPVAAVETLQSITIEDVPEDVRPALLDQLKPAITTDASRIPSSDVTTVIEHGLTERLDPGTTVVTADTYLKYRPDALAEIGPPLMELLTMTEHSAGILVLHRIRAISKETPGAVAPAVTNLAALCAVYGKLALGPIRYLAEDDPTAVLDAIPALVAVGEDGDPSVRGHLLYIFAQVSKAHPEALLPAVDLLTEALHADGVKPQTNALSTLGRIAGHYPDVARRVVDPVAELVDHEAPRVRGNAVGLLGDVAQQHPEAVIAHADVLAACLTDSDESVRVNASIALNRAGRADPEAIVAQAEHLVVALDDETASVRANACTLIGNATVSVPTARLRELRRTDPDEAVRDAAAYALSELSDP